MTIRNVIVTGATGRQGRGFIHALLNPSNTNGPTAPTYRIWAITRDAASPAATRLLEIEKSHGNDIRIVQGDLSNADRLKQIFTEVAAEGGIFGVFIVLPYPGLGNNGGDEERQGKALVDLAIEFKVEALVYSSTIPPGPDLANGIDASRLAKREIELYCKGMGEKGLNWSIVQPGIFMENFDGLMGALAVSVFSQGLQKETEMLLIASEDIGKVAAGVIQNHERYTHKTVTVAGGSYTMDEVKKSYKEVMGKNMPAFPAILAWLALKLSVGVQHVQGLVEDIRHWKKRLKRLKRYARCKISARGSSGGKKSNLDAYNTTYERDHQVQKALRNCEIAIVNNELTFQEMTSTEPLQQEQDDTNHPETNQSTSQSKKKKKKAKKNEKLKDNDAGKEWRY